MISKYRQKKDTSASIIASLCGFEQCASLQSAGTIGQDRDCAVQSVAENERE